jgi:broad specificity phosphatase PhoE
VLARLVLVKHARPIVDPTVPSAEWRLGNPGRDGARALAPRLIAFDPVAVVASVDRKAADTGAILAEYLGVPFEMREGLHEHERRTADFAGTHEEFQARIRALFDRPDELVFGDETARQAQTRFAVAVERAIAEWTPAADGEDERALIVVAHGTVISLLAATWYGAEPFPLWDSLGLPSYVVLSLPGRVLVEVSS